MICTFEIDSVRCRLLVGFSSVETNFDGDNEMEDTVRLIRFF